MIQRGEREDWWAHLVVVSGVSQQPSEGDGVSDAPQVDEEHGGDGLDVEALIEVTGEPGQLPLNVQHQTAAEPAGQSSAETVRSEEETMGFLQYNWHTGSCSTQRPKTWRSKPIEPKLPIRVHFCFLM